MRQVDPRLVSALIAARVSGAAIRRLGRGGGTAAPGLVADRIDPNMLGKISVRLPQGAVVVAGTNGKTTVSRMIADIFASHGWHVAHNRSGSNLVRGVASALAAQSSVLGNPRADIGVIESDEAAFPEIVRQVQPRAVLLNNLFRDQLDRYGELDTIANNWRPALQRLPASSIVVANVDDPTLASLTDGIVAKRVSFGLDDANPLYLLPSLPHAADAKTCRICGAPLTYDRLYSAHLGAWRCPRCGSARPALDVIGQRVTLVGAESLELDVHRPGVPDLDVELQIPGLYNAYNALAAIAVATQFQISASTIQSALRAYRSAFGRVERIDYRGHPLTLVLVKNPVGFNEALRMLTITTAGISTPTLIAINDLAADGRDVSWLWDVDFELLNEGSAPLFTTGIRGADMANRLKYAGLPSHRVSALAPDLAAGLDEFVERLPPANPGYLLLTYTALLGLRQVLADRGAVSDFWEE